MRPSQSERNVHYEKQDRKIFIGGLNRITTEDSLKEYFSKYGELVDIIVMKAPDTKRYVDTHMAKQDWHQNTNLHFVHFIFNHKLS